MTPVTLTIAGSDPCGGAGAQADLKTFHQHGVYGMSVLTLLTVQNTRSVSAVETLDSEFVVAQLDSVLSDIVPGAAKTGALGNSKIIEAIAARAASFAFPLVVDPVMVSKHGDSLVDETAAGALKTCLLPAAFLVTPNIHEARALTGVRVHDADSMEEAARAISALGPENVLVKGGSSSGQALDVLLAGGQVHKLCAERVESRNTHGTGCVLSAAITAGLARGRGLLEAVREAKAFVTEAIRTGPRLGRGLGPTNMHVDARSPAE